MSKPGTKKAARWRLFQLTGVSEENLERAMGFEPTTPTLARLCSTPELHPHNVPAPGEVRPGIGGAVYGLS